MAVNTNYTSSNTSPVDQILNNWAQAEDRNLAEQIQYQEIKGHLRENKRKNIQIREDFPKALLEQEHEFQLQLEEACACDMMDPPPKTVQYNDCEYKVELARPAMVQDEPIYENTSDGPSLVHASDSVLQVLSISDIASSKKAEEILRQEREDAKLALKLQNSEISHDVNKDYEYALHLYEKDKAKIARAKERSRLKKLALENAKAQTPPSQEVPVVPPSPEPTIQETVSKKSPEPKKSGEDIPEVTESQKQLLATYKQRLEEYDDEIVPPYMPMQCQSGKKSLALEDKLRKRKEKEGCSQQ